MEQSEIELSFQSTDSELSIHVQIVTPEYAALLLSDNHSSNRKLKPQVVESYKRQMEKGLWKSNNGEGLKISESNKLIDGQHRLRAVIEYGKPVEMLVFSGIPEESMSCIDDGIKRSLSDAMMINGKSVPNQTSVNGAISCLMTLKTAVDLNRSFAGVSGARRNSTSEMIQFYDSMPNFNEVATSFFSRFRYTKVGRVMPLGIALAMYYLLHDLDDELIYGIFKSYETGIPVDDLREASPVYHAYERARQARVLKVRIMPWEHIQTFLWVYAKSVEKQKVYKMPRFKWSFTEINPITKHAIKKLQAISV